MHLVSKNHWWRAWRSDLQMTQPLNRALLIVSASRLRRTHSASAGRTTRLSTKPASAINESWPRRNFRVGRARKKNTRELGYVGEVRSWVPFNLEGGETDTLLHSACLSLSFRGSAHSHWSSLLCTQQCPASPLDPSLPVQSSPSPSSSSSPSPPPPPPTGVAYFNGGGACTAGVTG